MVDKEHENPLDFSEYDDSSKVILAKVIKELREQWAENKYQRQFWFYAAQASDTALTSAVCSKWITILTNRGLIYSYKPRSDWTTEQMYGIVQNTISKSHNWDRRLLSEIVESKPESYPGIAIDLLDADLGQLLEAVASKGAWGKFRMDSLGRYYYDNKELSEINHSLQKKTLLGELLASDDHILPSNKFNDVFPDDIDGKRRRQVVYELDIELRRIDRCISVKSHKVSGKVDYYQLVVD